MKSGSPVGASTPPSGSSVTATVCPRATRRESIATPGRSNRPARCGDAVLDHPDLVVLAPRRRRQPPDDERGAAGRRDDEVRLAVGGLVHARVGVAEHREHAVRVVEVAGEPERPDAERDRDDGCHGRRRGEHGRRDAAPQRHDVRPLAPRLLEDPLPERSGRRRAAGRAAERARDLPEVLQLLAAALARGEVLLVACPLVRVERVERVARGQVV